MEDESIMPSFSERNNLKPKKLAQIHDIDKESRVLIWNAFFQNYRSNLSSDEEYGFWLGDLFNEIWCDFLKNTIDNCPSDYHEFLMAFKLDFFKRNIPLSGSDFYSWEWWKVYDFLEFVSDHDGNFKRRKEFQDSCNKIMERENLGYRFIDNLVVSITSKEEITEIENAEINSTIEVRTHLEKSLKLLSDRVNPDFSNSIKESISAVEAQCKIIAQDSTTTLGKALDKIERGKQTSIHPRLKEAFQKMYSWTNEDGGIRHALMNESNIDREDAQFMLIACSAFINYLHVKKLKSESEK